MSGILLAILIMISSILLGFFILGIVIPISCTIGDIISDKIESFLRSF